VLDYHCRLCEAVVGTSWVWGPYAAAGLVAVLGRGAGELAGPAGALVVAAVLLLVPLLVLVAYRIDRPVGGIDRPAGVGYLTVVALAAGAWTYAAGTRAWQPAAIAAAAVMCGALAWVLRGVARRGAVLSAGVAVVAGAAVLAGLRASAEAGRPGWWPIAGAVLATGCALPRWAALVSARRHARAEDAAAGPAVDITPTVAALVRHGGKPIHPVPETLVAAGGNWSVRLQLTGGQVLGDLARVLPRAESQLGLREGALTVAGTGRRDHITLTCAPQVVRIAPGGDQATLPASITQPLTLGVYQDGRPMRLRLYRESGAASGMLGGRVGSGKSRTIWAQLAQLTAVPDAILIMADLSGGVTSGPWRPCLSLLLTDEASTGQLLVALIAVAEARSRTLVEQRREVWEPTPAHPAIVVYIDEAQKVLGYGATARAWENMQAAEQAFQVLRKAGITVILSGPRPEQGQGISPAIRSQCTVRLCMAADASTAGYVFDGTPQRLAAMEICPTFDQEQRPGQILGAGPGMETVPGLVTGHTYYEAEAIAAARAGRRPALDPLSAQVFAAYGLAVDAGAARPATYQPAHPQPAAGQPARPAPAANQPAGVAPDARQVPRPRRRPAEPGSWTDADDRAAWALFGEIDRAAAEPLRVGGQPVTLPAIEVPPVPRGRMNPEHALQVAAALIVRPGGTTPAQVRAATGYPLAWAARLLTAWHDQGLVSQPEQGRYEVAAPP
jgi:hypothetical protein